jgi:hypothetical protein
MAHKQMYRQCELSQKTSSGSTKLYVAWLPNEDAIKGRFVSFKKPEPGYEGSWRIDEIGPARDEDVVEGFADNARRGFPSVSGREKENA